MTITVDNRALSAYTGTFRQLNSIVAKSAKETLNFAAMDVKKVTMPETSKVFTKRVATFLSASSKVDFVRGNDLNNMKSVVYFKPKDKATDSSVQDLEQQENGGNISGRSFIPLKQNRSANSWNKNVKLAGRYSNYANKMFDAKDFAGKSAKQRYLLAAIEAAKVGGVVIGNNLTSAGNRIVWKPMHVNRFFGNLHIVATQMFAVKGKREVKTNSRFRGFMKKAGNMSADKMQSFFTAALNNKLRVIR